MHNIYKNTKLKLRQNGVVTHKLYYYEGHQLVCLLVGPRSKTQNYENGVLTNPPGSLVGIFVIELCREFSTTEMSVENSVAEVDKHYT